MKKATSLPALLASFNLGLAPPAVAAHRAVMALNDYGKYFAHPGWKAIK